jgi:toxin ParE1/3/4
MSRLIYTSAAKLDLVEIAAYIAEISGHREAALAHVNKLRGKCRELAALPFPVGRLRPEFGYELRSYVVGNYILFFRHAESAFVVVAVVEGHRDMSAFLNERV